MTSLLNHITLSVSDLERSLRFYVDCLDGTLRAKWDTGAYLEFGSLWFCLSVGSDVMPAKDYSHLAFSISEASFANAVAKLTQFGVESWQENRSEGSSYYFLDPDGHKLELHLGDLESRLDAMRASPYPGQVIFE